MTKETGIDKALADLLEGKAEESLPVIIAYLEELIDATKWEHGGIYQAKKDGPYLCPHCEKEVSIPASHNTRIAAVRTWKEIVLDKVKGNKKDRDPKEKAMDFKKALEEVGKSRQEREARAEKAGKLARLPETPPSSAPKKAGGGLKLKALGKKKVSQE